MRHIADYMIGDWIIVEGGPVQIAAIHQKKVGYHKWPGRLSWVRLDQVQTIPLTPDFLIKNGFTKTRNSCYEWRRDSSFFITLEDRFDGIWDMTVEDYDRSHNYQSRKEVTGRFLKVHQIQHEFVSEEIKKEFVV
jgi:hypothetical protein